MNNKRIAATLLCCVVASSALLASCGHSSPTPGAPALVGTHWYGHEQKETDYGYNVTALAYADCDLYFTTDSTGYFFLDQFMEMSAYDYTLFDTVTVTFHYAFTSDSNGLLTQVVSPADERTHRDIPIAYSHHEQSLTLSLTDQSMRSFGIQDVTLAEE